MLMAYLPLVIARWIHFASVFALFGSSFFWLYEGQERSSAGQGGLPRTLRATTILLAPHRRASRGDFGSRVARVAFDQYDKGFW
jgi:hypothetical protein